MSEYGKGSVSCDMLKIENPLGVIPYADLRYLKLNGSNANVPINIGSQSLTTTGTGTFGNVLINSVSGNPLDVYALHGTASEFHAFQFDNGGYFIVGVDGIGIDDYTIPDFVNGFSGSAVTVPSILTTGCVQSSNGFYATMSEGVDSFGGLASFYTCDRYGTQISDYVRIDKTLMGGERKFYVDANYNLGTVGRLTAGDEISYPLNNASIYFPTIGLYLPSSEVRTSAGFVVLDDMYGDGSILGNVIQEFYGTIAIGDSNMGGIYLSASDGMGGTETTSLTYLGFNFGNAACSKDFAFFDSGGLYSYLNAFSVPYYNTIFVNGNSIDTPQLFRTFQKQSTTSINGLDVNIFTGSPSAAATDKSGGILRFLGGDAEGNGGTHQEFWAVKQGQGTGTALRTPNHIMSTYGDEVLVADSSQVSTEKITNGDFEAGSTGWTAGAGNTAGGYVFTVSSVTTVPTVGATYTNSGVTYTVKYTDVGAGLSGKGSVICTGASDPAASGNLTKASGTGDNTVAYSAFSQGGNHDVGGTGTLSQTSAGMVSALVAGEVYNLTYTISANTVGYVIPSIAGITLPVYKRTFHTIANTGVVSKTVTEVFKAIDTTSLVFTPSVTGARYVIDNVSLKKVIGGNVKILGTLAVSGMSTFSDMATFNETTDSYGRLLNAYKQNFDLSTGNNKYILNFDARTGTGAVLGAKEMYGGFFATTGQGTGTQSGIINSVYVINTITGAGTYTGAVSGVHSTALYTGSGPITEMNGVYGFTKTSPDAAGTVTWASAFRGGGWSNDVDSTVTNWAGLYILNYRKYAGTFGTAYGIYLAQQVEAATNWQFYSIDGNSAFGGNTRFGGVTAPTVAVDVTGAGMFSTYVTTPALRLTSSTPTTLAGDVNDWDVGNKSFIRASGGAADRIVTGILSSGVADGHIMIICNIGTTNKIQFTNESASSSAANRILTNIIGTVEIPPQATIQLIYDATSSRWREMSHL
jgi:hypothetical protein